MIYNKNIKKILTSLLAYKPEKVILFGSAAWGKWKPGSDLDFFIIKRTNKPHTARVWEVEEILFDKMDVPVDVVIYTPEEVKYAQRIRSMFIEEILKKGKVLYFEPPKGGEKQGSPTKVGGSYG
ncbi:MAG: nucleotidyltransferase domain-containing protein [Patescibacteria group bacterium]